MLLRILSFAFVGLIAAPLGADDKTQPADMAKAMEAMTKHATVGEHHKKLEPLIGDWTYKASFFMAPDAPPMEMTGSGTRKWIMDGRFMQDDSKSDSGMPFRGFGITGYDNALKKFVTIWIDSMTTSIAYGQGDMAGKVLTTEREEFNPLYGQKAKSRDVTKIIDTNNHEMEFYTTPPGGKEFKSGVIKFTRRK